MSRRVVGPFGRVEGDLEVQLEINNGEIASAQVVSSLYRGFEQILHGKAPMDALVYAPRICGICSVAQSVAAASALADAQGLVMADNGRLATNLVLATENLADHLTHFYLFFMPDFAREGYARQPWHAHAQTRFAAVKGEASAQVLPVRAQFLHLMGILAGKWPHSLALQPGGTTRALEAHELIRIGNEIYSLKQFLQQTLFGDSLETILAIDTPDALRSWAANGTAESSDLRFFLHLCDQLGLWQMGVSDSRFMSYGAYAVTKDEHLFRRGVWNGGIESLDSRLISEDVSHSWLQDQNGARHPFEGATLPDIDADGAYSWCKAPRLDSKVMEVGALARQQIDGLPLINALVAESGANVANRVIARLWETARLLLAMEQWLAQLTPKEAFCTTAPLPDETQGVGMIEAARGSLGHWLRVKHGRILNYQIIAPTTWNFSPRDAEGVPGALEQALAGTAVEEGGGHDQGEPLAVQHIVRSFDPCMVCTVH